MIIQHPVFIIYATDNFKRLYDDLDKSSYMQLVKLQIITAIKFSNYNIQSVLKILSLSANT
jgi:hypothetical protein